MLTDKRIRVAKPRTLVRRLNEIQCVSCGSGLVYLKCFMELF